MGFDSMLESLSKRLNMDLRFYLRGTFWLGLSNVVMALFSLFVTWALTVTLSKNDFGLYNFVLSLLGILSVLVLTEAKTTLVLASSKGRDGSYDYLIGKRLLYSLIGSVIMAGITLYFYFIKGYYWEIFLILILFFPLMNAFSLETSFLNGKERYRDVFNYTLWRKIFVWLPIVIIAFATKNLIFIMLAYFITTSGFDLWAYYATRKLAKNRLIEGGILKYTFELSMLSVISIVALYIDKIILAI